MKRFEASDRVRLDAALGALARAEAAVDAPPHLEACVLAAFDAHHARRRSRRRVWRPIAAAAAVMLLGGTVWLRDRTAEPAAPPAAVPAWPVPTPAAVAPATDVAAVAESAPPTTEVFRPPALIVVGEPVTPGEPLQLVRMRVAAADLAALGIEPPPRAQRVELELLVGEDGVARGVRLVM